MRFLAGKTVCFFCFFLFVFFLLKVQRYSVDSVLSLSRFPRDSLKYFEISAPRHIRFAELRKKNSHNISQIYICNWTPEIRAILKIM